MKKSGRISAERDEEDWFNLNFCKVAWTYRVHGGTAAIKSWENRDTASSVL